MRCDRELPVAAERTDLPAHPRELLRNGCVDAGADDDVAEAVARRAAESIERRQEDDAPTEARAPEQVRRLVRVEDGADARRPGNRAIVGGERGRDDRPGRLRRKRRQRSELGERRRPAGWAAELLRGVVGQRKDERQTAEYEQRRCDGPAATEMSEERRSEDDRHEEEPADP